jgi:voltage-gated potassium channel Kch
MLRNLRLYLSWGFLGILCLLTLALGAIGWGTEFACPDAIKHGAPPAGCTILALDRLDQWLDVVNYTLLLFPGETATIPIWPGNTPLQIARILGQIATYAVLFRLLGEFMASRLDAWAIRRQRGHVVVCGLGERGRAFALEQRLKPKGGASVVAVERAATESTRSFCETHRIHLVEGDCRDIAVLRRAAVGAAQAVIVVTGDDNDNLATAKLSRDLVHEAGARRRPFKAHVAINHPSLWRELAESDLIDRHDRLFDLAPFSLPVLAARTVLWDEPIYSYADIMDQHRVHAVLVGLGPYGESLLAQIARICVYKDFGKPAITVLAADERAARGSIEQHFPEADCAALLRFLRFDPASTPLDGARLHDIAGDHPITAVFVCLDGDDAALSAALYVQKALQRAGRATVPIYVRMGRRQGAEAALISARAARRFGDVVSAFGSTEQLCRLGLIEGALETLAIEIHEDYLASRELALGVGYDPTRAESAQAWPVLRETYREANRRAADHIKVKLASAGAWQPPGITMRVSSAFSLLSDPEALGALAELEHRSWCAGAYLNGWRHGAERDNRRKLHNNLVPYTQLDAATRKYDEDQIKWLQGRLLEKYAVEDQWSRDVIREDFWIGLIGRNHVTAEEGRWAADTLRADVLPKLLGRHDDCFVTLVTPLAPGLDLTLTRAALALLRDLRRPHRLLVVEGVPELRMIHDFVANLAGLRAGPWAPVLGDALDGDPDALFKRIADQRHAILYGESTERIIDLAGPQPLDHARAEDVAFGYRRAGDYVAGKCAVMIAAYHPSAPPKPGGTADTVERWASAATGRSTWPIRCERQRVRLDLDRRAVVQ